MMSESYWIKRFNDKCNRILVRYFYNPRIEIDFDTYPRNEENIEVLKNYRNRTFDIPICDGTVSFDYEVEDE